MKKIFAVAVALVMALSMMVTVYAANEGTTFVGSVDSSATDSSSDDSNGTATFYGTNVIDGDDGDAAADGAEGETAPNTGDNNNIVLWGSVFAVSAAASAVLVANRRKAKAGK